MQFLAFKEFFLVQKWQTLSYLFSMFIWGGEQKKMEVLCTERDFSKNCLFDAENIKIRIK